MDYGIAFAAVSAALVFQSASASQPLEPSGPWTVNYAESMCVLSREFGAGEGRYILGFRPGPMSDNFRIALVFPGKSAEYSRGAGMLRIDSQEPVEARFERGPANPKGMEIIVVDTDRPKLGNFSAAKTIRVSAGGRDASFKLPDIGAAMKAMDACEKDLLIDWGMDPAVLSSIKTMPVQKMPIVGLFTTNDYPSEALRAGEQGTSGVRFLVGKDGKATDCRIVESSGSKPIDRQTCKIIEYRARFEPARTQSGEPVESLAFQRIRWELGW